jgi:hypothetical protein
LFGAPAKIFFAGKYSSNGDAIDPARVVIPSQIKIREEASEVISTI